MTSYLSFDDVTDATELEVADDDVIAESDDVILESDWSDPLESDEFLCSKADFLFLPLGPLRRMKLNRRIDLRSHRLSDNRLDASGGFLNSL